MGEIDRIVFLPDCFLIGCFGSIRLRLVVPFEDAVQPFQKICFGR